MDAAIVGWSRVHTKLRSGLEKIMIFFEKIEKIDLIDLIDLIDEHI